MQARAATVCWPNEVGDESCTIEEDILLVALDTLKWH